MRANPQPELQSELALEVGCSWLGDSPRIAWQSYLLVTEDDRAKAARVTFVMVESTHPTGHVNYEDAASKAISRL